MADWQSVDRTPLRAGVGSFLQRPPGVLAVKGSDSDARHIAADIVCDVIAQNRCVPVRVRQVVDRPTQVKALFVAAWQAVSSNHHLMVLTNAIARGPFADYEEIITGISVCVSSAAPAKKAFVFDTIDEIGPVPQAALSQFAQLAKVAQCHVVVFFRSEASTRLPHSFLVHELGGLRVSDILDTIRASTDALWSARALAALDEIRSLAVEEELDADFAYDFFQERLS